MLALLLACITWFYVAETAKPGMKKTALQHLLTPTHYVSKTLDVVPIFVGVAPDGYTLVRSKAKVTPAEMVVLGPADVLSRAENIYTQPIDVSEYTKNKTIEVSLQNMARSVKLRGTKVQVYLPVEKAKTE